jgi:uncharacterized protein YjbI with pentapeptide repeats
VKAPALEKNLELATLERLDGAEVECARLEGVSLAKTSGERATFEGVVIAGGTFAETRVAEMRWMDVRCERCDISLVEWTAAKLTRVELVDCRMSGARWVGAELEDVRFVSCQLDYAIFSGARFRRVAFEKCRLRDADFGGADLTGTIFSETELQSVDFGAAKLEGADVRTSTLRDVRLTSRDVRGLVVTRDQAAVLAQLFGLVVKD